MARLGVVLGGGGIVGLGWELGIVEGLREAGLDLARADTTVGTSAGSIVGAVLEAGIPISSLPERAAEHAPTLEALTAALDFDRIGEIDARWRAAGMRPSKAERAAIGALAVALPTGAAETWVDAVGRVLGVERWPEGLTITAVRAEDGEFVAWTRDDGVPIATAVAASCALPGVFPAVPIDGGRYIDGGVRSPTNLDVAVGNDVVLAVVPSGGDELASVLADEAAAVRARGGRVVELLPDADGLEAIGPNLMDVDRLLPAALAGYEQGRSSGAGLAEILG